jgi:prepilin-type N-terminal cleavage/methylation domain-containing protein
MKKPLKAFTLLELSMVLVVVAIIISTSFSAFNKSSAQKTKISKDKIEELYKAFSAYVKSYGRLPCPSSILLTKGNANYGKEVTCNYNLGSPTLSSPVGIWQSSNNSNLIYGGVPIKELGLSPDMAEDEFGNKIAYFVLKDLTTKNTFDSLVNVGNGQGNSYNAGDAADDNRIRIHERNNSNVKRATASAVLVLMSYGANGFCAYPKNSATRNASATDADEAFNCAPYSTSGTSNFYNYNYSSSLFPFMAQSNSDAFDDIVLFKSRQQLVNDSKYFPTPACSEDFFEIITYGATTKTYYWRGDSTLGEEDLGVSATACPSGYNSGAYAGPTKKCGELRRWRSGVDSGCVEN